MNNIDPEILKAAKSKDTEALMSKLSDKDKEKLNQILSDKEALKNILNSPLAAELIKKFGGGKNG